MFQHSDNNQRSSISSAPEDLVTGSPQPSRPQNGEDTDTTLALVLLVLVSMIRLSEHFADLSTLVHYYFSETTTVIFTFGPPAVLLVCTRHCEVREILGVQSLFKFSRTVWTTGGGSYLRSGYLSGINTWWTVQ
ncbi:hypothetical protein PHET_10632 [Paragonimus heterotremus]|uniref:Uncharacterized protein n=1 Tax=Paragonimus heterotremus TaxID=100268 RepID=A0A8J4SNG3_9TREM|nr:hypothetical protein PHET_10632 [Paragonimus heterotremus]